MKFIFVIFFIVNIYANDYSYTETIKLAKDEHKKILVQYGQSEKIFKFRWTLYVNEGLVILRSYDRIVAQHVLYSKYNRSSFRVELKPRGSGLGKLPYMLVKFISYDFETNKAVFKIFLRDQDGQIGLEHLNDE